MAVLVLPWTAFVFKLRPEDMGLRPYGWTEEDERAELSREEKHLALPGVPLKKALKTVVEKLFVGWLNDKVGVQLTVNIQLAMVALGFIGFIFSGGNLVMLYISAFLFGAQNSLVSVSTPLLIRQIFGERDFPAIFTYARIGTGVIGCFGPVTVGAIFDATGSFIPAFVLGIGITALGFITTRLAYVYRRRLHWVDADGSVLPEAPSTKC